MKIFISWSGERGRQIAHYLKEWIPHNLHTASDIWMSDEDIDKGARWSRELSEKLEECYFGIICVTPENLRAPWIHYEAGALSKSVNHSRVCPVLFGMQPSDLKGTPLDQFQACSLVRADMLQLIQSINRELGSVVNEDVLQEAFDNNWFKLERKLQKVQDIEIESACQSLEDVIEILSKRGFPEPNLGRIVHFCEGFESHAFYGSLEDTVRERLWIFGRKNRKLFDKEHKDFLGRISGKVDEGFDFRCLFLDPDAPTDVLERAHIDIDFNTQLQRSIDNALIVCEKVGLDASRHFRFYNAHRTVSMVVADNAIMFSPIRLSGSGKTERLTRCCFAVMDKDLDLGEGLMTMFENVWAMARSLPGGTELPGPADI